MLAPVHAAALKKGSVVDDQRLSSVLVDFARTLAADFSVQKTLDHFATRAAEMLPVSGAGILIMDGEQDHHFVAATDEVIRRIAGLQMELGEGPCLRAYDTGGPVAVTDLAVDQQFPRFSPRAVQAGLRAVFSVPLRLEGRALGALELYADQPAELSSADLEAAQTLADVMAAYFSNARARAAAARVVQQLEHQALHDPLTGLPNRTLLHDRLSQALRSAQRTQTFVGVLFLDVDALKAVNDRHGHDTGDRLLRGVAERVQEVLRPGDTLARLGGDEFVVLCEELTAERQAEEVAARILASFDEPLPLFAGPQREICSDQNDPTTAPLKASVSIGIAFAGGGHGDGAEALRRADAAMYVAKSRGVGEMSIAGAAGGAHLGRLTNPSLRDAPGRAATAVATLHGSSPESREER